MAKQSDQSRRSFMSALTSLAGVTAIQAAGTEASAQAPTASAQNWDLRWMDGLKARHKQVFDLADVNLAAEPRALRFPRSRCRWPMCGRIWWQD